MQDLMHVSMNCCASSGHSAPASTAAATRMAMNGSVGGVENATLARDKVTVECLVAEYMARSGLCRQSQQQQQQHISRKNDPLTSEVVQALLALTDEYERRYKSQLMELSASWDINSANPRASFVEVLDTMLEGDCNWGRIVTVFIFIGLFTRKCQAQEDVAESVSADDVQAWAVAYILSKLRPWIQEHGGWMGLVRFYRDGDASDQGGPDSGMFRRLLLTAGAGLALFSISSLLANRA